MPELVPRNTSVSNEESSRVSDRMKAARIAGRRSGHQDPLHGSARRGAAHPGRFLERRVHVAEGRDQEDRQQGGPAGDAHEDQAAVGEDVERAACPPRRTAAGAGADSGSPSGGSAAGPSRAPCPGAERRTRGSAGTRAGSGTGQSVRAMIQASTTARASASTARTVESQTVVQRICHDVRLRHHGERGADRLHR